MSYAVHHGTLPHKPHTSAVTGLLVTSSGADKRAFRRRGDLRSRVLPALAWGEVDATQSLESLYRELEDRYIEVIDWYLHDKRLKSFWARLLRLLSILLTAGGGLVPLAQGTGLTHPNINLGYILLALAASCVAVDRFFGLSSSWMRDMVTAFTLQRYLTEMQLSWAKWNLEGSVGVKARVAALAMLSKYANTLFEAVLGETSSWVKDFRVRLSEADSTAHREIQSPQVQSVTHRAASSKEGEVTMLPLDGLESETPGESPSSSLPTD